MRVEGVTCHNNHCRPSVPSPIFGGTVCVDGPCGVDVPNRLGRLLFRLFGASQASDGVVDPPTSLWGPDLFLNGGKGLPVGELVGEGGTDPVAEFSPAVSAKPVRLVLLQGDPSGVALGAPGGSLPGDGCESLRDGPVALHAALQTQGLNWSGGGLPSNPTEGLVLGAVESVHLGAVERRWFWARSRAMVARQRRQSP